MRSWLFFLLLLCAPIMAQAEAPSADDAPATALRGTINDQPFHYAPTLDSDAIYSLPAVLTGINLDIKGGFEQALLAAGQRVYFQGRGGDDVIIGGLQALIDGDISGRLYALASATVVMEKAQLRGDAAFYGQSFKMLGTLEGNLYGTAGEVEINGPIKGNVDIQAEKLIIGAKAKISGSITHRGSARADIHPDAILDRSKLNYTASDSPVMQHMLLALASHADVLSAINLFAGFVLFAIILQFWQGKKLRHLALSSNGRRRKLFFIGLGMMVGTPFLLVVLLGIAPLRPMGLLVGGLVAALLAIAPLIAVFCLTAHYGGSGDAAERPWVRLQYVALLLLIVTLLLMVPGVALAVGLGLLALGYGVLGVALYDGLHDASSPAANTNSKAKK